jgi:hypothetical protein
MVAKIAIVIASAVALAPALAALAWQTRADAVGVNRTVELTGPIVGFNQTFQRIQVRLAPLSGKEARREILVRSAGGDASQSIPLKSGQTWASADLDAELAQSPALEILVQ